MNLSKWKTAGFAICCVALLTVMSCGGSSPASSSSSPALTVTLPESLASSSSILNSGIIDLYPSLDEYHVDQLYGSFAVGDSDGDFTVICDDGSTTVAIQLIGYGATGNLDTNITLNTPEWSCPSANVIEYTGTALNRTIDIRIKYTTPDNVMAVSGSLLSGNTLSFQTEADMRTRIFERLAIGLSANFISSLLSTTNTSSANLGALIETVISSVTYTIGSSFLSGLPALGTGDISSYGSELILNSTMLTNVSSFISGISASLTSQMESQLSTTFSSSSINAVLNALSPTTLFESLYTSLVTTMGLVPSEAPSLSFPLCIDYWTKTQSVSLSATASLPTRVFLQVATDATFSSNSLLINQPLLTSSSFPQTISVASSTKPRTLYARYTWSAQSVTQQFTSKTIRMCDHFDINHDGFADLVFGAAFKDSLAGQLYLWLGKSSSFGTHNLSQSDTADISTPGSAGATIGFFNHEDFNRDGIRDLVVSELFLSSSSSSSQNSKIRIFFGSNSFSASGFDYTSPNITLTHTHTSPLLAARLGDMNNDGNPDLVVSSGGLALTGLGLSDYIGRIYVVFGTSSGFSGSIDLSTAANLLITNGSVAGDGFGSSLLLGDFNNDGTQDIFTPANSETNGGARIIWGSSTLTSTTDLNVASATSGVSRFSITNDLGTSVIAFKTIAMGDINGDGIEDIVMSVPNAQAATGSNAGNGAVYVFYGDSSLSSSLDPVLTSADLILIGSRASNNDGSQLGKGLAVTDLNNDGLSDILVSAPEDKIGGSAGGIGMVFAFYGSSSRSSPTSVTLNSTGTNNANFRFYFDGTEGTDFGVDVGAQDVNGDGSVDSIIRRAEALDAVGSSVGQVHIFDGSQTLDGNVSSTTQLGTFRGETGGDFFGIDMLTN